MGLETCCNSIQLQSVPVFPYPPQGLEPTHDYIGWPHASLQTPVLFAPMPEAVHTSTSWEISEIHTPNYPRGLVMPGQLEYPASLSAHTTITSPTSPRVAHLLETNFRNASQNSQYTLLYNCINSFWLHSNELEPKDISGHSILLGFATQEHPAGGYKCLFDGCGKSFDRQDRVLGHIRMHLGHSPYACDGGCRRANCMKRFSCHSYLQSHLNPRMVVCPDCHRQMVKQNLPRHQRACQNQGGCIKDKHSFRPY